MVRFGAKKEEFIPPFLFSLHFKTQKKRAMPSLFYAIDKIIYALSAYNSLTAFQSITLKNALI